MYLSTIKHSGDAYFTSGNTQFGKFWFKQHCLPNSNNQVVLSLGDCHKISPQLRNEREGMIKEDIVCSVMQLRIDNARKLNIQLTLVHTFKSCGIWIAKKMQITLGRQDTKGILDALYKWFYPSCYPFPIRTGRKELTRGTVVKCITSTFLHFLGFISFNIYLWLGWENYINVGILRSHAYFGSCWNLEEQR